MSKFKKNILRYSLVLGTLAGFPGNAVSQSQNGVIFGGSIGLTRFCEILLVDEGVIAPNIGNTVLSSRESGGAAGRAQVRSSRNLGAPLFILSAETPTGFVTSPSGVDPGVIFGATYQATVQIFSFFDALGNPNTDPIATVVVPELSPAFAIQLPPLATRTDVDVHFDATAPVGAVFPSGSYSSVVTLRCE